jgi:hypothetical protein
VTGAKRAGSISAEQSFAQGVARAAPLGRAGEAISGGGKGARRRSEGVAACQHGSGCLNCRRREREHFLSIHLNLSRQLEEVGRGAQ